MTEYAAMKVMEFIEIHTPNGAVVRHLTELHQMRDAAIYGDLRHTLWRAGDEVTLLKLDEMYG